ncbi:MAG: hypothetical protein ACREH3_02850, partial [Geminicoccales bacterium]
MAADSHDRAAGAAGATLELGGAAGISPGPLRFGQDVMRAMEQVIVGQRYMLERLLVGLLANGHVL